MRSDLQEKAMAPSIPPSVFAVKRFRMPTTPVIERGSSKKKELSVQIRACAKSIREKYAQAPYTIDFTVTPELAGSLRRDYPANLAASSTMSLPLNGLSPGLCTVAIEKKSRDPGGLKQVRAELQKLGDAQKSKQRLRQASGWARKVDRRPIRTINPKLQNVSAPQQEPPLLDFRGGDFPPWRGETGTRKLGFLPSVLVTNQGLENAGIWSAPSCLITFFLLRIRRMHMSLETASGTASKETAAMSRGQRCVDVPPAPLASCFSPSVSLLPYALSETGSQNLGTLDMPFPACYTVTRESYKALPREGD